MSKGNQKVAIVGASTLAGKELNEALNESALAAADFVLLDTDEAVGKLENVGDEVTFVRRMEADSFAGADFVFFAGTPENTREHWQAAHVAGATVVDMSHALETMPGVPVRAPWVTELLGDGDAATQPDLRTPAVVAAHPAAVMLATVLAQLQTEFKVKSMTATVLEPASQFGRDAMDELHQQTVTLLSFQTMPKAVYDAQAAFNVTPETGAEAKVRMAAEEERIRRHYAAIAGKTLPESGDAAGARGDLPRRAGERSGGDGAAGERRGDDGGAGRRACGCVAGRDGAAEQFERGRAVEHPSASEAGACGQSRCALLVVDGGGQSEAGVAERDCVRGGTGAVEASGQGAVAELEQWSLRCAGTRVEAWRRIIMLAGIMAHNMEMTCGREVYRVTRRSSAAHPLSTTTRGIEGKAGPNGRACPACVGDRGGGVHRPRRGDDPRRAGFGERIINASERQISEMAYELLAKEQPMAIDLRFILAVIKINADLERMGDQSINIAERAVKLGDAPKVERPAKIRRMGEHATRMIRLSIEALMAADAGLAEQVLAMDDEMDEMNSRRRRR